LPRCSLYLISLSTVKRKEKQTPDDFQPPEDERQEHAEQNDFSQETLPLGKNGKDEIGLPLRQEYLYDMSVGKKSQAVLRTGAGKRIRIDFATEQEAGLVY
jgi:hypothetical protein